MNPRSAAVKVRMTVPLSMTLPICSRPLVNLMLSTAVGMLGNVLRTFSTGTPGSNGVKRLGSNVSVCAMPPAIQSTMTASAVAVVGLACDACSRGSRPTRADSVAAAVAPMKPRRLTPAKTSRSSRVSPANGSIDVLLCDSIASLRTEQRSESEIVPTRDQEVRRSRNKTNDVIVIFRFYLVIS